MYYFNEEDRELLKKLSEGELYVLCCKVTNVATESKRAIIRIISGQDLIRQLVLLAETTYAEIARREDYKPKLSNGEYGFGATCDTEEVRSWIIKHRGTTANEEFLNNFSFAEVFKEL